MPDADVDAVDDMTGWTPLLAAVNCSNMTLVDRLVVEAKADTNIIAPNNPFLNDKHCTALSLAAAKGDYAMVYYLIVHGAIPMDSMESAYIEHGDEGCSPVLMAMQRYVVYENERHVSVTECVVFFGPYVGENMLLDFLSNMPPEFVLQLTDLCQYSRVDYAHYFSEQSALFLSGVIYMVEALHINYACPLVQALASLSRPVFTVAQLRHSPRAQVRVLSAHIVKAIVAICQIEARMGPWGSDIMHAGLLYPDLQDFVQQISQIRYSSAHSTHNSNTLSVINTLF